MKVLILSTYDTRGGAAKAAYRLNKALYSVGVNSQMLVQVKYSNDINVQASSSAIIHKFPRLKPYIDSLPKLLSKSCYQKNKTSFSLQWLPNIIDSKISSMNPDIINLHWISGGFLNIETIARLQKPIVWTLHDMWAFTGGCHYSQECKNYQETCRNCPQMPMLYNIDLSNWVWQRKVKAWKHVNGTIIALSNWMASCAASSALFKNWNIEVIPNSLDINIYKEYQQKNTRALLNLPQDKHLILFGAENATSTPRKGFHMLRQALINLSKTEWKSQCELVIFGNNQSSYTSDLGFKVHYLGKLIDEIALAQLYSAVDVFVAPSLQDNLPNTVMESLACGTPCVAFNIGGMPDLIEHHKNGYLATPFEIEDLAKGITWILENANREFNRLRYNARKKIENEFTMDIQASRYLSLFKDISQSH